MRAQHAARWSRREFLGGLTLAGTASGRATWEGWRGRLVTLYQPVHIRLRDLPEDTVMNG